MNSDTTIGFNRLIRREWADRTLAILLRDPQADVRAELLDGLKNQLSSGEEKKSRGNALNKTVGVLGKMWFAPEDTKVKEEGITLAGSMTEDEWVFLHACQAIAVYPFFRNVVHSAGRAMRFGGACSLAESTRKAYEQYGERESVHRCVRYVYHTLLDWGLLVKTTKRGHFAIGRTWSPKTKLSVDYLARVCAGGRESLYWSEFVKDPSFFFVTLSDEPNQKQRQAFERHGDDFLIQFRQD